ncbi:carbohydrate ABC transporter permease [Rhizobium sp. AG207R]|uniref:carbohydrate ABC transporter permease n=1 Tax=Rhizobium sp. AG207R TaxID=2802287 RepID=UPI0022AC57AE|nr:sugar ABC transporter permease [Rhizobium sp. AG207R]MCZ3374367.1 sugar ABC transporter permease [Rhizobium sp. AG207R]
MTRKKLAAPWREHIAPIAAMSPSLVTLGVFVYGFIAWTVLVSLSASKMVPDFTWVGFENYWKLWRFGPWRLAVGNFLVFSVLYVAIGLALGLFLAILIDQRIRAESLWRTIFLYPIALSFVVTGVVWRWIMNPTIGVERFVRDLGFANFEFAWISDERFVVYTLVIAGLWQVAGFVTVLFLSALRGVDGEIIKAASLDGARPWRIYLSIIVPSIWPVFLSAGAILVGMALKTFDLVVVMTQRGPGSSSEFPATFMYDMAFRRNQLGIGSASAVMILLAALIIALPALLIGAPNRDSNK